jgi:hypothetical protein
MAPLEEVGTGEPNGGEEEEVIDVAVHSPELDFSDEDEEGGKVVWMALSDGVEGDLSSVVLGQKMRWSRLLLGEEENGGRRREVGD